MRIDIGMSRHVRMKSAESLGEKKDTVLSTDILAGLPFAGNIRILSGDRHIKLSDENEGGVKSSLDQRSELAERQR